jgi:hypothetical protein
VDPEARAEVRASAVRSDATIDLEAMLICSMSVSVAGFLSNREGAFGWSVPSAAFH